MKINCIIVDDEHIAREGIMTYIKNISSLNLIASCKNTKEAVDILKSNEKIDLIFLDIEMPEMSGIEFLKNFTPDQIIVLTTAYAKYAIDGFEFNVLDYLLKPISLQRFNKCVEKITDYMRYKLSNIHTNEKYIFGKNGQLLHKIPYAEILFIEAFSNYYKIFTSNSFYIQYGSLYKLQEKLDSSNFKKVHRSYIVNIEKITSFNNKYLYINDTSIPISGNFDVKQLKK